MEYILILSFILSGLSAYFIIKSKIKYPVKLMLNAAFLIAASLLTYYEVATIVDMKENTKWLCLCACAIFEAGALLGAFLALLPYIRD